MREIEKLVEEIDKLVAKATPGPWWFDSDWHRLPTIFGGDKRTKIAVVEKISGPQYSPEQAANAGLIETLVNAWPALRAAIASQPAAGGPEQQDFLRHLCDVVAQYERETPNHFLSTQTRDKLIHRARETWAGVLEK